MGGWEDHGRKEIFGNGRWAESSRNGDGNASKIKATTNSRTFLLKWHNNKVISSKLEDTHIIVLAPTRSC